MRFHLCGLFGMVLLSISLASSQEWIYAGTYASGFAVAMDSAGRICIAGPTNQMPEDIVATKLNRNGDTMWTFTYDSPQHGRDICLEAAIDPQGTLFLVGETIIEHDSMIHMLTLAIDSSGALKWADQYADPDSAPCMGRRIAAGPCGKVYVTGKSGTGNNGPYWVTTVCYDTSGRRDWVAEYFGQAPTWNDPTDIVADELSNIYVCIEGDDAVRFHDYLLVKYDSNGGEKWTARYDGPAHGHDNPSRIGVDSKRNVFVTGISFGAGPSDDDWATVKYDSLGSEQWVRRLDGTAHSWDEPEGMVVDSFGNVFVTGYTSDSNGVNLAVAKYTPEGGTPWVTRYELGARLGTEGRDIALSEQGRIYATGAYSTTSEGGWVTWELDSTGQVGWSDIHSVAMPYIGAPCAVIPDPDGCIYVGGCTYMTQTVLKYANPQAGIATDPCGRTAGAEQRTVFARHSIRLCLPARTHAALADASGRTASHLRPGENDISHLAPGIYFLHGPGVLGTMKVVVVR